MRYDVSFGPSEMHNRISNFDPFVMNSQTKRPGVLNYAGVNGYPNNFVDLDRNNFGPRIGFAWDPRNDRRMAIRGGYGLIYTTSDQGNTVGDSANPFGYSIDTPFAQPAGVPGAAFQFSQGPASTLQPLGSAGGPSAFRGLSVRYQDRNAPVPCLQQWNVAIQRSLWQGWVVSAVYAGSKGTKLFGGNYNLNQLDPKYFAGEGSNLQRLVDNPFLGQITTGPLASRQVQAQVLLRPFPDYQTVQTFANNNASTIYHSLQLFAEKRFSNGVSALVS
jgi:hypothetical protein